ncbi:MAG: homocysteine S-methyltransferase family protein, partial [Patescibacteria group bacterium]
ETFTTSTEAIGAAKASQRWGVRPTISWVLNQEGKLLTGQSVADAIREVDSAVPGVVRGFGLNCCPVHAVQAALVQAGDSAKRIEVIYPNAFDGNAWEAEASGGFHGVINRQKTAEDLALLAQKHGIEIVGGCCGYTPCDVEEITRSTRELALKEAA